MPRYIVTIRKPYQPQVYYLSKSGFRCYTSANVAVFHSERAALDERNHFATMMRDFELHVEQLPAGVRSVAKAVLSACPVPGL